MTAPARNTTECIYARLQSNGVTITVASNLLVLMLQHIRKRQVQLSYYKTWGRGTLARGRGGGVDPGSIYVCVQFYSISILVP